LNIPHIAINMDDAAKPAPAEASSVDAQPVAKAVSTPKTQAPAKRVAAAEAPIAVPVTPAAAPVAEETVAAVPMAAAPPVAEPVRPAQPSAAVQPADDTAAIAGAIGAGVLALAGGAFAFGRRRRKGEREQENTLAPATRDPVARDEMLLTDPAPVYAAPIAASTTIPARADVPVTAVPAGFDMSRYGRHVQAAYRGPTADNRSLSLRNRLRRARFFDQRERMAAEPAKLQVDTRAPVAAQQAAARRQTEHVVSRQSNWTKPGFSPAFQS
jgi:hypothetical protein